MQRAAQTEGLQQPASEHVRVYRGAIASRSPTKARQDLLHGLLAFHIWGLLGWQDIRQRYRRSVLGPFWLTLSTAIMVGTIGFLYSKIFNQPLQDYLPFLAVGLIVWNFIASSTNEGCAAFLGAEAMIRQVQLPLTTYICRVLWRNILLFAHNSVIFVIIAIAFNKLTLWPGAMSLVGFGLLCLNFVWIMIVLATLCARFGDIAPIVASVLQIAFFLTPILWDKSILGRRDWFAEINPVFHLIELVRAPLLGTGIPYGSILFAVVLGAGGFTLALFTLARFRARVPYWL